METTLNHVPTVLVFQAVRHPSPQVHHMGLQLDEPYVERCWTPILGPTAVLLLRRLPVLWLQSPTIGVRVDELAASLGVGRADGKTSPLMRAIGRLVHMRFAVSSGDREIDVYTEVRPLGSRQLARVPDGVRLLHERLLAARLEGRIKLRSEATPHTRHESGSTPMRGVKGPCLID